MKKGLTLSGICALLGATSLCARADDSKQPPAPNLPAPAAPTMQAPTVVPYVAPFDSLTGDTTTAADPESAYLQESDRLNQQRAEKEQMSAYDAAQRQQSYDNDWMLRDYTAALKEQGLALPTDPDYALVKAPTTPGTTLQDDPLMSHPDTDRPEPRRKAHDENSDDLKQLSPTSTLAPLGMKPLLPPLADAGKPARDPWAFNSSQDADNPLADNNDAVKVPPVPNRDAQSSDSISFLDTPGATAQQDGLITPPADSLLSLQDPLPDQDTDRAKPKINNRTNFLVPTAPTNDVTEFFKKQAEALNPPTAPNAPTPAVAAKPYVPMKDPFPFAKPVVNPGMHSRVADPFDLLHR